MIEVLIASLILLISVIGGVAFFSANHANLIYSTQQRLAIWSAADKLEELKGADYNSLNSEIENITLSKYTAQRTTTVVDIDEDGGGTDYKEVTVEVDWGEGNDALVTYITPK